jgi:phenylpropionate dioxygenase-like ring-hydroxylating dioxygenase large terminal subunit
MTRPITILERSWYVVARSIDLNPGPVSVELLGRRYVVARLGAEVAALESACPHRGTDLALGDIVLNAQGTPGLRCPYHGWTFDSGGACTLIPSLPDGPIPQGASTGALAVVEADGLVWANLELGADPSTLPALPTHEPGMRTVVGEPMVWNTSAGRHVENILDLGHFPFVHPGTFGCPEAEPVASHHVERGDGWIAADVPVITRNPQGLDGLMYPDLGPLVTLGYRYEVVAPYRITLKFAFPDGMRRALHEVVTPNRRDQCTIYWHLLVDERLGSNDEDELAFAHAVFAEDRPIIESQPPGLPLDVGLELHVPADRLSVAYRRLLRDLGCTTAHYP